MHRGCSDLPRYTGHHGHPAGAPAHPAPGHHHHHDHGHGAHQGHCASCCHPKSKCHCHHRECRKEAKELLVQPTLGRADRDSNASFAKAAGRAAFVQPIEKGFEGLNVSGASLSENVSNLRVVDVKAGLGTAFIGGGCCVHLSIEYAPSAPTSKAIVAVLVDDSEGTILAWAKTEEPGVGYQIKEGIITTKPGADLTVLVVNATARVRWCEIFSC